MTASHHVFVNGQDAGYTNLPGTGAWNQFSAAGIHVNLNAGTNTIRLARGSNWAEIDYIELPIYEAEDGQVTAANINSSSNASNGAKVGQIDQSNSAVLFDVYAPTSGNYTLQVGYSDGFRSMPHIPSLSTVVLRRASAIRQREDGIAMAERQSRSH